MLQPPPPSRPHSELTRDNEGGAGIATPMQIEPVAELLGVGWPKREEPTGRIWRPPLMEEVEGPALRPPRLGSLRPWEAGPCFSTWTSSVRRIKKSLAGAGCNHPPPPRGGPATHAALSSSMDDVTEPGEEEEGARAGPVCEECEGARGASVVADPPPFLPPRELERARGGKGCARLLVLLCHAQSTSSSACRQAHREGRTRRGMPWNVSGERSRVEEPANLLRGCGPRPPPPGPRPATSSGSLDPGEAGRPSGWNQG
jgi:hypothetical protein